MWQAPFASQKLKPVLETGMAESTGSILDVGCGPGTNAKAFEHVPRYLGIDLDENYIRYARDRYQRDFQVVDVTRGLPGGERFETVLMNSLMHHLDDDGAQFLLKSLRDVLAPNGVVHVVDLVLPESGLARRLALADRGDYPRSSEAWSSLVSIDFDIQHTCEYDLGIGPLGLWRMVHFQLTG